jgi:hypothetical protein
MLLIIFFMSFIMGMLPIPPPIMPAPPCGAAAEGLGAGAGVAGADFSLSAGWEWSCPAGACAHAGTTSAATVRAVAIVKRVMAKSPVAEGTAFQG